MKYYGKTSSTNHGISKWRRGSTNPGLPGMVEAYDDFKAAVHGALVKLGPCILPGGRGQPQIVIAAKYTKLITIKGEWPVLRTGNVELYEQWAKQLIAEYPEHYASSLVVYQRKLISGTSKGSYKHSGGDVVYFIGCPEMPYIKIGTSNDPAQRLTGIQTSVPYDLEVLLTIPGDHIAERQAHQAFEAHRKRGEWFKREGKLADYLDYMSVTSNPYLDPWEFGTGM
jgi:hypothetical protein